MIGNVINTVITRLSLAVFSIFLLILNSNFLGSEGLGSIGILILEISIFLLFTNLVCGGSMVFFASRNTVKELLLISYGWILLMAALFAALIGSRLFHVDYAFHVLSLGIIQSVTATHINILAGKQKIKRFNLVGFLQVAVQFITLCFYYFFLNQISVKSFIYSTYIGYSVALLVSFGGLFSDTKKGTMLPKRATVSQIFNYGFYIQLSNLAQLLNYRLSYFLLNAFSGKAAVGQFMPGVQFSEGILLPGKSIATVQFSKIANIRSREKSARLSLKLLKLTLLLTLPLITLLVCIPASLYELLLGEDFSKTPLVIAGMSVGILTLAGEIILSRYFSGTGQQKYNAKSTILGLVITLVAGFLLIPPYGILGAAICSSLSFSGMFFYMLVQIIRQSNLSYADFLIKKNDFIYWKRLYRSLKKTSSTDPREK